MDLAHPGRALAPTLDVIVLEVLARTTTPLPLSQIHRLAGTGSVSGHLKALTRLRESGLVLSPPGGYSLNREHVATPAVEAMATMRSELLDRIRKHVRAWRPAPAVVGVFGSFARRDGDTSSDIDILVVRDFPPEPAAREAGDLAAAVRRWSGNEAHIVDITKDDLVRLAAANEPILASWQAELIPLIGALSIPEQPEHSRPERRHRTSRAKGGDA
jgi:predicted nucleotidyltransferase